MSKRNIFIFFPSSPSATVHHQILLSEIFFDRNILLSEIFSNRNISFFFPPSQPAKYCYPNIVIRNISFFFPPLPASQLAVWPNMSLCDHLRHNPVSVARFKINSIFGVLKFCNFFSYFFSFQNQFNFWHSKIL